MTNDLQTTDLAAGHEGRIEKAVDGLLPMVADSWSTLRGCDCYRLLEEIDYDDQRLAGAYIVDRRGDLADAVLEALDDLESDANGASRPE